MVAGSASQTALIVVGGQVGTAAADRYSEWEGVREMIMLATNVATCSISVSGRWDAAAGKR